MFQPGDLVVYGAAGVCRVEEIGCPDSVGAARDRENYLLKPLQQDGVIYTPVDSEKAPIRSVISQEEAEALIDLMPTIRGDIFRAPTVQTLAQRYQAAVRGGDCRNLVCVMKSIYAKRRQAESRNRRLGMVDERYMKQAERLLYGELSAALGIPFDEVAPYISRRIHAEQPAEVAGQ